MEWGAGCAIYVHPSPGTYRVSVSGGHSFLWLAEFARPQVSGLPTLGGYVDTETPEYAAYLEADNVAARKAAGCAAAYLQAIIGAPRGALLRWDSERGEVVDELAEEDDFFAEEETREEIDLRENEVPDDSCPACGGNGLDTPYAAGCGRCGA